MTTPRRLPRLALFAAAALAAGPLLRAADEPAKVDATPYATDFSAAKPGKVPEELFVITGAFAIADVDGNRVLELAGNPVSSYGVLFGPKEQTAIEAAARVQATSVGKMFPEFGVGANDSGGWRVWAMPGQDALVLRRKEVDEVARVPFHWTSGGWVRMKLRVSPGADGKWLVQGKAWPDGLPEPAAWPLSHVAADAPPAGQASVWGNPYSGTPIRFDDLSAAPVGAGK